MARRYSSAQLRSKLRQAEQKQRQAVSKYNQDVRRHNQKVRAAANAFNTAVNRYNHSVRVPNSRVRANQSRLRRLSAQLSSQPRTSTYVVYRESVQVLHQAYSRFEQRAESHQIGPEYNWLVDLAEREAANSVEVANRLLGVEPDGSDEDDALEHAELGDRLRAISPDLHDRWVGAVFSLSPRNPDAARHFCTSAREIFARLLDGSAPDAEVFAVLPQAQKTDRGNATRRSKIQYLLHRQGMFEETLEEFVEANIENVVQLFHVLSDGTHGSAGTFGQSQLDAIKQRVEDGITFLTEIIGGTPAVAQ